MFIRRTETVAVSGTEGATEGEGLGRYPGMCPHSSSSVYVFCRAMKAVSLSCQHLDLLQRSSKSSMHLSM